MLFFLGYEIREGLIRINSQGHRSFKVDFPKRWSWKFIRIAFTSIDWLSVRKFKW